MSLFKSAEEKEFEKLLVELVDSIRTFLSYKDNRINHINSFLYDDENETIPYPTSLMNCYYGFETLIDTADNLVASFIGAVNPLINDSTLLHDPHKLWDFMFLLYFARDFGNYLRKGCESVNSAKELFENSKTLVQGANLSEKHKLRAINYFSTAQGSLKFVENLLIVDQKILSNELFFLKLYSILFSKKRNVAFSHDNNKYTCRILTFPAREIQDSSYMKLPPLFNYYLRFYSRQIILGEAYSASSKIVSDQERVINLVETALKNVLVNKSKILRLLFGSSHRLTVTVYVFPIMDKTESGFDFDVRGYYRFYHGGHVNSPVISVGMGSMKSSKEYETVIFHELIHYADQHNLIRESNVLEGDFEGLDLLRAEGLTTVGELFLGVIRDIFSVYTIRFDEDFFKSVHDRLYSLSQTMSLVILLDQINMKKIHTLNEDQIRVLFAVESKYRADLEEGFRLIKLTNFELYIKKYIKACQRSETIAIPIIAELAKRLGYD